MKTILRKSVLIGIAITFTVIGANAQRIITGTVYREGKPAAGVVVEGHKTTNYYTSFDGKYKIQADKKSKWLKFTYADDTRKLNIEGNTNNVIDFSFDGKIPVKGEGEDKGVNLKSAQELMKEQNKEFMNDLSLYAEFYKQKEYKSALPHWKSLFDKYPKSTSNIYIHGVKMYESFIKKATSWEEKEKYIDKMMEVYDRRIKYFDHKGYVLGRKGTDWFKYMLTNEKITPEELKEVYKKGYEWLDESIKLQGDKSEVPILVVFMQATKQLFKLGELSKETVVKNYETCNNIINAVLKNKPDNKNATLSQTAIEQIFGTSGAADCEALVSMYTPQFAEKSGDIDFVKSMLRRLNQAGCNESPLFEQGAEQMYELNPSGEAAFNMARMFLKKGDPQKAKQYYQQAMKLETDQSLLENYYYEFAAFMFAQEKNLPEARSYARKALAINPKNCKALMLIGDIYVAASRTFSDNDFERSTVFWVAVDYFNRARSADSDCATDAASKAATYRAYFPNKETGFFNGLEEGKNYQVKGWINETTKVRY